MERIDSQTKKDAYEYLVWMGFTKKDAKEMLKTRTESFIRDMADGWKDRVKKAFYED